MTGSRIFSFVVITLLVGFSQSTSACSIVFSLAYSDKTTVFIGEVVGHTSVIYEDRDGFGLTVKPLQLGSGASISLDKSYEIFPYDVQTFCSPFPITQNSSLESIAPIGAKLALIAKPSGASFPGDMAVTVGYGFDRLKEKCDLDRVMRMETKYESYRNECGSMWFHGQKDLMRLPGATEPQRLEILRRLSKFRGIVNYTELVGSYVSAKTVRDELVSERYGDLVLEGCNTETEKKHSSDIFSRFRYSEYCS